MTNTTRDPEALYDRLAGLTDEMSDDQRRDLAELLLSGDVDAELLALVLRDQATVESDGRPRGDTDHEGVTDSWCDWDDIVHGDHRIAPLAPEDVETVESAPKYRDDTRLLQCCGVARPIGHRAGCAEAN